MTVALRRRMTIEAFLAWEERQEERWEFDGFAALVSTFVTDPAATLDLPEIGVALPLANLYENVFTP